MSGNLDGILAYKKDIDAHITHVLSLKKAELGQINPWGTDVIDRLIPFITGGKCVRGSLILYTYALFQKKLPAFLLDYAGAIEMLHAGLLIHDDIMDSDKKRRGSISIHEQYRRLIKKSDSATDHFGLSMGINAADLCFFMAHELLSVPTHNSNLQHLIAKELQKVVIAQMQDVEENVTNKKLTREAILSLYRYKTARYTFSLPMVIGATAARVSPVVISSFEKLGESMGILYQLRDDELNKEGDSGTTGKSTGSDAKNAKQTLARLLTVDELAEVKTVLLKQASQEIERLPIARPQKAAVSTLLEFCYTRNK